MRYIVSWDACPPIQWALYVALWFWRYSACCPPRRRGTQYPSELIAPDGGPRIIEPPPMLVSWSIASNVGGGNAMLTRSGMLWNFVTWRSYWRMQGIYLRTPRGALLRVEDAHVPGHPGVAVSPDGCSLFYLRRPGRPDRASQPPFLSLS